MNFLRDLLNPIDNPRYLIIKTNWFKKQFKHENYYSVPEIFGDKKEHCLLFQKHWNTYFGKSKIQYARHLEGRKLLLKARLHHLSNAFKEITKENIIWK